MQFIQTLAGSGQEVGIGHDLESSTTAVRVFPCDARSPDGTRLVLVSRPKWDKLSLTVSMKVDTPGFDDSKIRYFPSAIRQTDCLTQV